MGIHLLDRDARGRCVLLLDYSPQGRQGPRLRRRFVAESGDLRVARREAERFLADRMAERINARTGAIAPARTVADAVNDYMATACASHRDGYTANLARTLAELARRFQDRTTADITADWLQRWQRERAEHVKPRTVNRELAEISAFLAFEVKGGRLNTSPVERVDKLKEDRNPALWLRPAEYAAIWQAAPGPVRDALDVLVATGLRHGELRRLRPEHVQAGQLTILGRKARDFVIQPVGALLLRVLCPRLSADRWPCLGRLGYHLARLAKKKGVPRANPKSLRHTCATWLLAAGVDVYRVRLHLGHSTVVTTENYVHFLTGFDWQSERDKLPARTLRIIEETASRLRHTGAHIPGYRHMPEDTIPAPEGVIGEAATPVSAEVSGLSPVLARDGEA